MSATVSGSITPLPVTSPMFSIESSVMKNSAVSSFGSLVALTGLPAASWKMTSTEKSSTASVFSPFVIFMCASKAWRSSVSSWTISIFTRAHTCACAGPASSRTNAARSPLLNHE